MSKNFIRGDRVIARNDFLGYYYPGKITRVLDSKMANIEFETGEKQKKTSLKFIRKLFDVRAYFTLGDHVLASVINEYEQLCWVPGIIQSINDYNYPKLYTVLYFNGQESENIKLEMVKISKSDYGSIVENIRHRLGLNTYSKNSTDLKPSHEIKADSPSPRPQTPPDLGEIKREIVDQIKDHLTSLHLAEKYETINNEFTNLKEDHKDLRSNLGGKLRVLKHDFEEWKNQEPTIIKINANNKISKTSPQTSKPGHQSSSMNLEKKILKLRSDLPQLTEGEPVLAKWPENGWYYHSSINEYIDDYKYDIRGDEGQQVEVYREDIIPTHQKKIHFFDEFNIGDPVVALHPHYELSYAPGQVIEIDNKSQQILVRFYDYNESPIEIEEVFKLHILKFQKDIDTINYLESKWIGKTVLARNNESNIYEPGKIVRRVGNTGRQFVIEWENGDESLQNFNHILGGAAKKPSLIANECVFALRGAIFCPARIVGQRGDNLIVKYYDGEMDENMSRNNCYWISKSYYKEAGNFYKNNKDPIDFEFPRGTGGLNRGTPVIDAKQFYSGKKRNNY